MMSHNVSNRRISWFPALFMFAVIWIAFTSLGWWWLFFAFWFVIPLTRAKAESYNTKYDVIVVDKRKNGDKLKNDENDEYEAYSNGDGRYIQTQDGDWLEVI